MKILIVDDNRDILYTVKQGLEFLDETYDITCALNAKECLDYVNKGNVPDLILLDIMMPGVNGWDLFAKLKEIPMIREVPIVFLTAKTDEFSQGFGKLSAHDYITKPFDINELKQRIEKILKR